MNFKKAYKKAFTLAEVLITLTIVGVIASMTIPTVIADTQNKELEVQFKKAYSVLSNAVSLLKLERGSDLYSYYLSTDTTNDGTGKQLYKDLLPLFRVVETDPVAADSHYSHYINFSGDTAANSYVEGIVAGGGNFTTLDGMEISAGSAYNLQVSVDINGNGNPPDRWGYDLFDFYIGPDNVLVHGNKTSPKGDTADAALCSMPYNANAGMYQYNGTHCGLYALTDPDYFKNLGQDYN